MQTLNEVVFNNQYDNLMQHLDRASALANFAIAARFSEVDDATMFGYFEILADIIGQIKKIVEMG